jgi:hypothetical protein
MGMPAKGANMRFWIREIFGWFLVGLGLYMFYLSYAMMMNRMIWEAGQWSVVGIIVFRGGIHLLKVAVAARVCLQAADRVKDSVHAAGVRPPDAKALLARAQLTSRAEGSKVQSSW